jgi:quercetin dioxygenase-like cupin family protein
VLSDRPAPRVLEVGGSTFYEMWSSDEMPVVIGAGQGSEPTDRPITVPAGVAGTNVRIIDCEPGSRTPMHRTETLDYGIVVAGRCTLELDDGSRTELSSGDVVIQRGTNHGWLVSGEHRPCDPQGASACDTASQVHSSRDHWRRAHRPRDADRLGADHRPGCGCRPAGVLTAARPDRHRGRCQRRGGSRDPGVLLWPFEWALRAPGRIPSDGSFALMGRKPIAATQTLEHAGVLDGSGSAILLGELRIVPSPRDPGRWRVPTARPAPA